MNVLDLFSGIGGFSLGLERAGMRTVAFCEIDPYARAVLRKHWPSVPCYDDVRTLTADRLNADGIVPDVICGGFPCQDISTAGAGAGIDGDHSGLWSEYLRLVRDVLPRYVILENSPALTFRGLGSILGDMASIRYAAEWSVLSSCRMGAPHSRERLYLVAYPDMDRLETFGSEGDGNDGALLRGRINPEYLQTAALAISSARGAPFASEPELDRVADGLPNRVDRNHAIGNSLTPQIPQIIGEAIMFYEQKSR